MLNVAEQTSPLLPQRKKMPIIVPVYLCLIGLWAVTSFMIPGFATYERTMEILHTASFLGIVATAQTIVVIMGGIDLSVSGVMTLSSMIIAALIKSGVATIPAIVITMLCCACVGVFNAFGVNFLSIPPMIMTMATLSIIEGSLLLATNGTPPSAKSDLLTQLAKGKAIAGIPNSIWIWALVALLAYWLLNRSKHGRYLYGIGTNQRASTLSGIETKRLSFAAYIMASALAGLAGVLYFGYIGNTYITLGSPFQMDSIAATVLGGTSIIGGTGNCLGTIAGALILTILKDTLNVLRFSQAMREMILGAIIVVLLFVYGREKSRR